MSDALKMLRHIKPAVCRSLKKRCVLHTIMGPKASSIAGVPSPVCRWPPKLKHQPIRYRIPSRHLCCVAARYQCTVKGGRETRDLDVVQLLQVNPNPNLAAVAAICLCGHCVPSCCSCPPRATVPIPCHLTALRPLPFLAFLATP